MKEAARVLDVSTRTLFTLTQAGEVRSVKIGASVKYSPAALAAFIRRREGRGDIDLTDLLIRLQGSRHEEAGRAFKFAAGVIADSDPSITPEKLLAFVLTHRLRGMGTPGGGDDEGWMTARLDRMASTGEAAKLVAALKRNFLGLMKETD